MLSIEWITYESRCRAHDRTAREGDGHIVPSTVTEQVEGVGGGAEADPGHTQGAGEGAQATRGEGKAAVGGIPTWGVEHWVAIIPAPFAESWACTSGGRCEFILLSFSPKLILTYG